MIFWTSQRLYTSFGTSVNVRGECSKIFLRRESIPTPAASSPVERRCCRNNPTKEKTYEDPIDDKSRGNPFQPQSDDDPRREGEDKRQGPPLACCLVRAKSPPFEGGVDAKRTGWLVQTRCNHPACSQGLAGPLLQKEGICALTEEPYPAFPRFFLV